MQEKRESSAQARASRNRVKDSERVRSGRANSGLRRALSRTPSRPRSALYRTHRTRSAPCRVLSRTHSALHRIRSDRAARMRSGLYRIPSVRAASGRNRPRSARTDRSPVPSGKRSGPSRRHNGLHRAAGRHMQPVLLQAVKAPDKPNEAAVSLPPAAEK